MLASSKKQSKVIKKNEANPFIKSQENLNQGLSFKDLYRMLHI